jgi:hypothetical protein
MMQEVSFDSRVPATADVTHFIQTRSCCRSNKNNKEGPRRRPLDKKKRTQILKACQSPPLFSAGSTGKTLKKSFCSSCCCGCWEQTIGRLFIHSIRLRHGSTVHSMGGFFKKYIDIFLVSFSPLSGSIQAAPES